MEIGWTDRAGNEEELQGIKKERNNLHRIKRRKADCNGHILRRNCFLEHIIGGKIEGRTQVIGRRGRRCM